MSEFKPALSKAEVLLGVLVGIDFRNEGRFPEEKAEAFGGFEFGLERIVGADGKVGRNER